MTQNVHDDNLTGPQARLRGGRLTSVLASKRRRQARLERELAECKQEIAELEILVERLLAA